MVFTQLCRARPILVIMHAPSPPHALCRRPENHPKQEVSMDGSVVLRRTGPSWFGFRKKDPSYELRASGNGLEILRQGKPSWSLDAKGPTDDNNSVQAFHPIF